MHNQSKELWLSGGLGLCGQSTKVRNKPENEPDIDIWNIKRMFRKSMIVILKQTYDEFTAFIKL